MATPSSPGSALPEHFEKEWSNARGLIEKLDERIHDTRKIVFSLFSSLLTAQTLLGAKVGDKEHSGIWLGAHLTLLGLLVTGRFIEQQALLLQAATASRAWVLELLTPVELTGILSDRYASGWARNTTYIYAALGVISALVTSLASSPQHPGQLPGTIVLTGLYIVYVVRLGRQDIAFARDGQDWSFSTTSCCPHDAVSILLVNQSDKPIFPSSPVAELKRVFDERGKEVAPDGCHPLFVPDLLLDAGRSLPPRRACRWVWHPPEAGIWALQIHGRTRHFARRFIQVEQRPADSAHAEPVKVAFSLMQRRSPRP